jgi:hypothetical protein
MLIIYVLAAFLVFIAIATAILQLRLRKHKGVSREEFILAFGENNIPSNIPKAVYEYYVSQVFIKGFTVAPEDSYEDVFKEDDEEIDDDAIYLVKQLGMKFPDKRVLEKWGSN